MQGILTTLAAAVAGVAAACGKTASSTRIRAKSATARRRSSEDASRFASGIATLSRASCYRTYIQRLWLALLLILAAAGPLDAALLIRVHGGSPPSSGSSVVYTMMVTNTSGSTTPTAAKQTCITSGNTCFPKQQPAWFALGAVPTGYIAVPTVGGSPVLYQADELVYWPDGSLRGGVFTFFLPQLTAGGSEQITWTSQLGSYNNTSSGTVADVTGATDYKVELTNESQVTSNLPGVPPYNAIGWHVSGGAVTSAFVRYAGGLSGTVATLGYDCTNSGAGCGTQAVGTIYGCSVAPVVDVTYSGSTNLAASASVVSGGSGCAVDGSGSYVCEFNTTASTAVQFKKGPLDDAWEAHGPCLDNTGGAPHPWLAYDIIVEHLKNVDGTTYGFRANGMISSGFYQASTTVPSWTYDACWQNGSAPIRGWCGGSGVTANPEYEGIQHPLFGGWLTNDANNQVDNFDSTGALSANDAVLKAVFPTPSTGDESYLKGTGLIPPYDDNARTSSLVTPQVLTETGTQNGSTDECSYYPFGFDCVDAVLVLGNGGSHNFVGPLPLNEAMWYLVAPIASDHGLGWLQSMRMAAAGQYAITAGNKEPATGYAVNYIGSSGWSSASVMTPVRSTASTYDMTASGATPLTQPAGQTVLDWGHWGSGHFQLDYMIEGERWVLRAMDDAASAAAIECYTTDRQIYFSTGTSPVTTPTAGCTGDGVRQVAWSMSAIAQAATFLPTSEPDQSYYQYLNGIDYAIIRRVVEFVGQCGNGYGPTGDTRSASFATMGQYQSCGGNQVLAQFMAGYWVMELLKEYKWYDHTFPDLDQIITYMVRNYFVKETGQSCPYNTIDYTPDELLTTIGGLVPIPGWNSTDPSNPQQPMLSNIIPEHQGGWTTTNGSSVLTSVGGNTTDYPLSSGTPMPAGSRITPANVDEQGEGLMTPYGYNVGPWPPPPAVEGTWYYYCPTDATHGEVATGFSGGSCTGVLTFTANTQSNWGIVPNASCPSGSNANWELPSGRAGSDSRFAEYQADASYAKAVLGDFTDADTTITNYNPINATAGGAVPYWLLGCTYSAGYGC